MALVLLNDFVCMPCCSKWNADISIAVCLYVCQDCMHAHSPAYSMLDLSVNSFEKPLMWDQNAQTGCYFTRDFLPGSHEDAASWPSLGAS